MRAPTLALMLAMLAAPALAQPPMAKPGAADPARVAAGTYMVDPGHTQIGFSIDHMGFTPYYGTFSASAGTLTIDPAARTASVEITVPISTALTTSSKLTGELVSPMFFDPAKYPTATFKSTSVAITGTTAKIMGDLTLHGVTKPITINAKFYGAGTNGMSKKATVGFTGTAVVKRSEFGMGMMVPLLGDDVDLMITAAFQK